MPAETPEQEPENSLGIPIGPPEKRDDQPTKSKSQSISEMLKELGIKEDTQPGRSCGIIGIKPPND